MVTVWTCPYFRWNYRCRSQMWLTGRAITMCKLRLSKYKHREIRIVQGHACKQRRQLQACARIGPGGRKPASHWQRRQDPVILGMTETCRACAGHVSAYRGPKGCNGARSPSVILLESNCSYLAIAWQVEAGLLGGD